MQGEAERARAALPLASTWRARVASAAGLGCPFAFGRRQAALLRVAFRFMLGPLTSVCHASADERPTPIRAARSIFVRLRTSR
jgi:hypothetical protein